MNRYAIVVAYEPDIFKLARLCKSICVQGFNVVVIDNSEKKPLGKEFGGETCKLITLERNMGIAHAQNIGVKYAISQGAQVISFFDQDSVISNELLTKLAEPLLHNQECVIAPVSVDKESGLEYPSHVMNYFGLPVNVYSKGQTSLVPVDIAISSGMTTSAKVFELVGCFDEDFFIDFVDIEWCIRSKARGIPIYIVPDAVMEHSIGDQTIRVGPVHCVQHSPVRTYYKVRNSLLLFRKKINLVFVMRQVVSALLHNLLLLFFVKGKLSYLTCYINGILHGMAGQVGKYSEVK